MFCIHIQFKLLFHFFPIKLFDLPEEEWDVNVQSLSGSHANFAVYSGIFHALFSIVLFVLPPSCPLDIFKKGGGAGRGGIWKYYIV